MCTSVQNLLKNGFNRFGREECLSESLRRQRQLPENLLWDNALILHSSNLVEKKCKILAQIRKKSALLIKAAASSCYARLHKLEKRHIRLFRSFCKSGNNDVFKWDLSMVSLPSIHPFWFYLWRAMHTAQLHRPEARRTVTPSGEQWPKSRRHFLFQFSVTLFHFISHNTRSTRR